jgi:hypothetical protein
MKELLKAVFSKRSVPRLHIETHFETHTVLGKAILVTDVVKNEDRNDCADEASSN